MRGELNDLTIGIPWSTHHRDGTRKEKEAGRWYKSKNKSTQAITVNQSHQCKNVTELRCRIDKETNEGTALKQQLNPSPRATRGVSKISVVQYYKPSSKILSKMQQSERCEEL